MNILLISILSAFLFTSCAHHHGESAHHHHKGGKNCELNKNDMEMFKKHCAQSVSEGDSHVNGSVDYTLNHAGELYYFSTQEKMDKFKLGLEQNIQSARAKWDNAETR
jgi:YHS domain-containing protein